MSGDPPAVGRFELPDRVPTGWYRLGTTEELPAGTVRSWSALGVELVVWADASARVHAFDATCPHLGADLAHGGCVRDGRLVCPFHGWSFGPDGRPVAGGAGTTPLPVRSIGDRWYVFVAHDRNDRGAPGWEPVDLHAPSRSDPPTLMRERTYDLTAHQQVIIEGDFDAAHFPVLHARAFQPDEVRFERHRAVVDYHVTDPVSQQVGFVVDGLSRVRESVVYEGVELLLVADSVSTASDRTRTHATLALWAADARAAEAIATRIERGLARDLARDAAVWEQRDYGAPAAFGPDDKLLVDFRRWARRFYLPVDALAASEALVDEGID